MEAVELYASASGVFDAMDCDGKLSLDVHEIGLFWRYCFQSFFNVSLNKDQQEALFHLLDMVRAWRTHNLCRFLPAHLASRVCRASVLAQIWGVVVGYEGAYGVWSFGGERNERGM